MKKSRKKSDSRGSMNMEGRIEKAMSSAGDIDLRAEGFMSRETVSARTLGGDAALHP